MKYDGYCSDTNVATSNMSRRKMRENCQGFTCVTPWVVFLHWFNGNKSKDSRNRQKAKTDPHIVRKMENMVFEGSINCGSSSSPMANSVENWKEASLNIGVGFGLAYLVASRTNEVNKLLELHHKLKMQLRQQISQETLHSEEHESSQDVPKRQDIGLDSNQFRREKSLRMDQLEAELAAEFDRLHLQMEAEMFSTHSKQQFSEINFESSAPEDSQSITSFEEVSSEPAELSYNEFYSVPPSELERRLHEVLEERQQERIYELESALECAMHHLEEKERQLSWWKDTARLISQHMPPAVPGMLMRRVTTRPPDRGGESRILSLTYEKSLV